MLYQILQILLSFLPPPNFLSSFLRISNTPLVKVFNSMWVTCTLHHPQGGCLNCFAEGPDLCRSNNNTSFVTVSLTEMFDTSTIDLKVPAVRVFNCYLYARRRLSDPYVLYNRVLDELLERFKRRHSG